MSARPISLSSDFGTADWYVGAMKGVLAALSPASPLIDLIHDIPAHDPAAVVVGVRVLRVSDGA